jgi:hypothetical protein
MENLHTHIDQSLKTTSYTAREEGGRERDKERERGGGGREETRENVKAAIIIPIVFS